MKAYVFPGQGAQYVGMGKDLYDNSPLAKELFEKANDILGFRITELMFHGAEDDLKQTKVTQPAIFLHSVILANIMGDDFKPDVVAGHSLGEFSALVANKTLAFEDGLILVSKRALAMQEACEVEPSTMAAIIGLEDEVVVNICNEIDEIVVPANFNCPGQLVISGSFKGIDIACKKLIEAGAKRAIPLNVGGAFHSPLMEPAGLKLATAIENTSFRQGICPIYQNVNGESVSDVAIIKENLIKQLTSPVKWTQIMTNMITDGITELTEVGPGNVLQGLLKKVDRNIPSKSVQIEL
ncbi:MAG: ACP S-malonyltransferase [Bacteroidales bacterium]|jgi:[acyl-carrier-protein] S-malonyltransferase|nr:ACP S-malonyltransferase [Bacteroidales bacterium]